MAARARRQFLADLGRDVEPASQGSPQADQGRLRSLGQARCRSQGPRLPHGQRGGGTHREGSPCKKGDRGTQGEIALPARPDASEALDRLMDAWHEGVTAGGGLQGAIGFDSHMERRDWESAKQSIERTYGRSSLEHRFTLDTLSAAIRSRRMLGPRLTYPGLT